MLLHEVVFSLTPAEVLQEQFGRRHQQRQAAFLSVAEEALAIAQPLFHPAAIYEEYAVRDILGERVLLSAVDDPSGEVLGDLLVGPKVDLLAPAVRLLVTVYTIGPALEEQVQALQATRKDMLSYMLDCVGVLALGLVGERMRQIAEEQAAQRGWGVGPALSPGSLVGWPVQGQRELCALLSLEEIEVRLNEHCVLEPHKSVSLVIGMGPEYDSTHVGSVCHFCSLADRCWRRREDKE
jgi:hypothetical protein